MMKTEAEISPGPCQICGFPEAQGHFGAVTCRACAAFFRRYVNSKKLTIRCKCRVNSKSKHPCRLCRLRKCESIGMKSSLVQPRRDSHKSLKSKKPGDLTDKPIDVIEEIVIEKPIVLRTMERIEHVKKCYDLLRDYRNCLSEITNIMNRVNMYEFSCISVDDFKSVSNMIERTFPEIAVLRVAEKEKMFSNFYTKWSVLEFCIYSKKMHESWSFMTPIGHLFHPIENFYFSSRNDKSLTQNETVRIFSPYWAYFLYFLVPHVHERKLHNFEFMALLALSFLDSGYSNLSEECVELCNQLKPLYLKELCAYYSEMNFEDSDARFFEILDILRLVEKGEMKAQEELQMCCVYDVLVNEDYRKLFASSKY